MPFQFQRADQAGGAPQLVVGQQPQRVAHDDADPGPAPSAVPGIPQPPQHHGERRETQVRLRLAAAGREEQQVGGFAVGIGGVHESGQVQEQEPDLEGTPLWVRVARAGGERPRDGAIRHPEGVEGVLVRGENRDAAFDAVGGQPGLLKQSFSRHPAGSRPGPEQPPAGTRSNRGTQ